MGVLMANGEFVVMCSVDCEDRLHILIERDYEGFPYAWQMIVGDHEDIVEKLKLPIENYLETVDSDSAFSLQPGTLDVVELVVHKILSDIKQAEEDDKLVAKEEQAEEPTGK